MMKWNALLLMMKLGRISSRVITLLFCVVTTYAIPAERKTVSFIGLPTCEYWTAQRKEALSGRPMDGYGASLNRSWVLGFLSAINLAVEDEKNLLGIIDADAIALWLDRYCARNPKEDVAAGALELVIELKKIAR